MRARVDRLLVLVGAAFAAPWLLAAEPLGTLFHTAEERARLDRLRRGEATETAATASTPSDSGNQVTGFVKRSDGRNTVWIDGIAVPARSPSSAPLLDPRAVRAYADRKQSDLQIQPRPPR